MHTFVQQNTNTVYIDIYIYSTVLGCSINSNKLIQYTYHCTKLGTEYATPLPVTSNTCLDYLPVRVLTQKIFNSITTLKTILGI